MRGRGEALATALEHEQESGRAGPRWRGQVVQGEATGMHVREFGIEGDGSESKGMGEGCHAHMCGIYQRFANGRVRGLSGRVHCS